MILLERKVGEAISLFINGSESTIRIMQTHDNNVRISIDTPPEILVLKSETITPPGET